MDRRPLKSRGTFWAQKLAQLIAGTGISPNQISILSIVMSLISLVFFYYSGQNKAFLVLAALFIQLRLLCNLFDGMVAVEYGKKTNTGDIYNDAPDRIADLFIIVGLGLSVTDNSMAIHIAWFASAMAIMTAYVRVLGKSLGTESYFIGPMAKQHRMALVTLSAITDYILYLSGTSFSISFYVLCIIAIGSTVTCFSRLSKIIKDKERGV